MSYKVEVSVGGLTELIKNLARDCSNHQWLREFTKNSFEAIETYRKEVDPEFQGQVIVDFDPFIYEMGNIHKIQFIDNGIGMTERELRDFPRQLSSTSSEKKRLGNENYGVGAKISSLTRNHFGIQYESWRDGEGHSVWLHYDDEHGYCLKGFEDESGIEFVQKVDDLRKHKIIEDHGTIVTLWGMTEDSDTMLNSTHGLKGSRDAWIQEYLNKRYLEVPSYISLKSRDGYYKEGSYNSLRNIYGMSKMLEESHIHKGVVKLDDADVHWYVLDSGRSKGHGRLYNAGHTAVVHDSEIFDITSGNHKQPRFGIGWRHQDIVLHVHPKGDNYHQNISRNSLSYKGEDSLPYEKWQDQFSSPENFPEELRQFLDDALQNDDTEGSRDLRRKLKKFEKFYPLSSFKKYHQSSSGTVEIDSDSFEKGLTGGSRRGSGGKTSSSKGSNSGFTESYLSIIRKDGSGRKAKEVSNPFPEIKWTKEEDGLVTPEEIRDRAAVFRKEQHMIFANEEYAGFVDTISYFKKEFPNLNEKIITNCVHDTFGTQLLETVAGIMCLEKRKHWAGEDFDTAISPEALSVAVASRMFFYIQIDRELKQKIKHLSAASDVSA